MFPYYEGEYEPTQNNIGYGSAREIFMKKDENNCQKTF